MSKDNDNTGLELNATIIMNKNFLMYLIGAIASLKWSFVKYLN